MTALKVNVHARVWDEASVFASSTPLILVAGLGVSSGYWVPLGRRLARDFHVLAPDLPGFGRTHKPPDVPWPGGPDVREQADHLLAWLDARGLERVTLCGHSNGCQTVVDLAVRFPHRVERVILASPTYEIGRRSLANQLPRLALAALFEKPSLHPILMYQYASAGLIRVLQQAIRTIHDPIEQKLPTLQTSALVIRGEYDPLLSQQWAAFVESRIPSAVLVSIKDAGHAVQYSSAAVMAKVVRDFLSGNLDPALPPASGAIIAPVDDAAHDPLGPPQPISPRMHAVLDCLTAAAALTLPSVLGFTPRMRRLLGVVGAVTAINQLLTANGPSSRRKLPIITNVIVDIACGLSLLTAAGITLRRGSRSAGWTTALLGSFQIATAMLTAKPTGPATISRPRRSDSHCSDVVFP